MTEWNEIVEVLRRQGMPAEGIQMVKLAFDHAPVRKELGHGGNVRTDYHSRKTGRTFRTESHTNELPLAEELERDPTVLWYVLQPFKLELMLGGGLGSTRVHVTPDALVVRESRVDVEEWKLPKDYVRLPEKHPRRYRFDGEEVTSPPMVAKLSPWGMGFRVRHPGHLTGEFLENCQLLADYLGPDTPDLSTVAQMAIKVAFEQQGMWSMEALREAQPVLTADDVYIAIAKRLVFFDLSRDRLATPHLAFLYSSELRAQLARRERELQAQALSPPYFDIQVGMVFLLDGNEYTVDVVGTQEVVVSDGSGAQRRLQQSLLRDAYPSALKIVSLPPEQRAGSLLSYLLEFTSDADLKESARKLKIVRGELPVGNTPRRTLSSWRRKVADAEALGHDGLVGLIPNRMTQGNRSARIDKKNMDLIEETLRDRYFAEERPTKRSAYGFYEVACSKAGIVPVSEQTFGDYADLLQTPARDHKRHGSRLAKARRPAHVHEAFAPSVHGVYALDILAIDHTLADVELRSEIDAEPLGRPWLSVATSTYSRKILADHLSYMAPNSSVVLALLREVARKTGRLPRLLVVDNGPDFRSAELERFCEAYRIEPRWRPRGDPRFGAVMERTFGKLNTEFFHRLRGSTKVMTAVRTMTGSHLPEKITAWTLRHLKMALGVYIEVDYNEGDHPTLAPASKNRVHRESLEKHGSRVHKRVFVDRTFNILCCPSWIAGPGRFTCARE